MAIWKTCMHFEYKEDDHDNDEKIFLGEKGNLMVKISLILFANKSYL